MKSASDLRHTNFELDILQIIWRLEKATVRQVLDGLSPSRELALTTVTTVLNRMVAKGLLKRHKEGPGKYYYKTIISQERTKTQSLRELVRRFFSGSTPKLIQNAIDAGELSAKELDEIQELLKRARRVKS
jgi:BlaI family transcriptional regulator, penicillinase repressor